MGRVCGFQWNMCIETGATGTTTLDYPECPPCPYGSMATYQVACAKRVQPLDERTFVAKSPVHVEFHQESVIIIAIMSIRGPFSPSPIKQNLITRQTFVAREEIIVRDATTIRKTLLIKPGQSISSATSCQPNHIHLPPPVHQVNLTELEALTSAIWILDGIRIFTQNRHSSEDENEMRRRAHLGGIARAQTPSLTKRQGLNFLNFLKDAAKNGASGWLGYQSAVKRKIDFLLFPHRSSGELYAFQRAGHPGRQAKQWLVQDLTRSISHSRRPAPNPLVSVQGKPDSSLWQLVTVTRELTYLSYDSRLSCTVAFFSLTYLGTYTCNVTCSSRLSRPPQFLSDSDTKRHADGLTEPAGNRPRQIRTSVRDREWGMGSGARPVEQTKKDARPTYAYSLPKPRRARQVPKFPRGKKDGETNTRGGVTQQREEETKKTSLQMPSAVEGGRRTGIVSGTWGHTARWTFFPRSVINAAALRQAYKTMPKKRLGKKNGNREKASEIQKKETIKHPIGEYKRMTTVYKVVFAAKRNENPSSHPLLLCFRLRLLSLTLNWIRDQQDKSSNEKNPNSMTVNLPEREVSERRVAAHKKKCSHVPNAMLAAGLRTCWRDYNERREKYALAAAKKKLDGC
ncbi:uncharacterized protein CLUP02_05602 [Colletotrichum lupini]|uniref:Uncharacterized protein n=1 Tax=Colletotrichum lupini TaxID=145971 RepID=A0A9Q8WEX5_9PEZI|nr:uncharacterized protein CLUP02_05602 [Colletotrichum lupini]UQC80120.1 hypothetical protein CLUP02_05602 [Colletotrichum lupini]